MIITFGPEVLRWQLARRIGQVEIGVASVESGTLVRQELAYMAEALKRIATYSPDMLRVAGPLVTNHGS